MKLRPMPWPDEDKAWDNEQGAEDPRNSAAPPLATSREKRRLATIDELQFQLAYLSLAIPKLDSAEEQMLTSAARLSMNISAEQLVPYINDLREITVKNEYLKQLKARIKREIARRDRMTQRRRDMQW